MGHEFCQAFLREVRVEVIYRIPYKLRKQLKSWGYRYDWGAPGEMSSAEFQIPSCKMLPSGFMHSDSACCTWYVRAKGWAEFLNQIDNGLITFEGYTIKPAKEETV